ncbi:MAG: dipeptide ABC transporter ATP-binding protein [Pseudonocardiaceae bacterium]
MTAAQEWEPLLSVRDLRVSFAGRVGEVPALNGANLSIRHGQTVAIVGESGSGKSTLAHAVLGLLPASARVRSGEIYFEGRSLLRMNERGMRAVRGRAIALIPQNPTASLNPVVPIGTQVAETLRIHDLTGRRQARHRAIGLLSAAGLPDAEACYRQYPHELSGGMQQRVLIAIALAGRPKLVVADEPTSALDVTVQAQVLDHLAALTENSGTACLLITHDLGIAIERAELLVVMADGMMVESGPTDQILDSPRNPRSRALVSSAPSLNSVRLRPSAAGAGSGGTLLEVRGLTKVFAGPGWRVRQRQTLAVDDVSFTLERGETLALVGESGAGKSTVARLLVRLVDPSAGQILFDGADLATVCGPDLRRFRRRVQMIFQDPDGCLDPRFTVAELIEEPLRAFQLGDRAARRARVCEVADQVALPLALLRRCSGELSGGQCQRVAIARAIGPRPDLLVCDEPASWLDATVQEQVLRLLVELQGELGLSYLFISHDFAVVRQVADRVAVMRAGRIVEQGPADQILAEPTNPYTQVLLSAVPAPHRR